MIDEFFDRKVDQWSVSVPAYIKPRWICFSNSAFGWRLHLYAGTLWGKISGAFTHISSEENMDLFMRETAERGDDGVDRILKWMQQQIVLLRTLEEKGRGIRFGASLFLMLLSALGVLFAGQRAMAAAAASLCLYWLSVCMESGYAPVAAAVRQRYLAEGLLRTGSLGVLLIHFFRGYIAEGVPSNVILQGTMIVMLAIHVILYICLIMLNTRQPFFLRALAGLTGAVPALTAASAAALAASCLFRPWPLPLSGILCAAGALLLFLGDQLTAITHLGGIRLKFYSIWVCLLMTAGFTMVVCGAWTYTL